MQPRRKLFCLGATRRSAMVLSLPVPGAPKVTVITVKGALPQGLPA
jgi:hypothetical protein